MNPMNFPDAPSNTFPLPPVGLEGVVDAAVSSGGAKADAAVKAVRNKASDVAVKASGFGKRVQDGLQAVSTSLGLGEDSRQKIEAASDKVQAMASQVGAIASVAGDDAYAAGAQIVKSMVTAYELAQAYIVANPRKSAAMIVAVLAIGAVVVARRSAASKSSFATR